MLDFQLLISSLGWSLIHFLWQGTLITLGYWVITRSVESINAKYWVGMVSVVLSLAVPIINISSNSWDNTVTEEVLLPLSGTIISHRQFNIEDLFFYAINTSLPFIVFIWAFTVVLLSTRLARSWMQLATIKHQCDPRISNEFRQYIKDIAIKLDLPVIPFLKISKQVMVPAAYGVFKPTILLPLSLLSQIPRNQLEAIIKHELCHLKRNDFIHNIIQLFADIVLFFHPGIRWMNNDIRHVREQCCDQMVLSYDTETLTYAKALTNIAAYTNGINLKHSVHLGINDGVLLNRVKYLLQNKSSQSSLMVLFPFLLFLTFAVILLQPNHSLTEKSTPKLLKFNPEYTDKQDQNPPTQKKRMLSQQFYPAINKSTEIDTIDHPLTSKPVLVKVQQQSSNPRKNKKQLQNELTREMQLQDSKTNLIDISAFKNNYQQPIKDHTPKNVDITSELITSNTEKIKTPEQNQPSNNIALESFTPNQPISLSFKKYVSPIYPEYFWFNQVEQDVISTFRILPNGRAYDIKLSSQKNNFVAFEQAVEKAIKNWRFDIKAMNNSTLQRTYQQIFSFNISEEIIRNCESKSTGSRIGRLMPCSK